MKTRVLLVLISLALFEAQAEPAAQPISKPVAHTYRLNALYVEPTRLITNPQSTGAITLKIKAGSIDQKFLKTALDLTVKIPSHCIESCEVQVLQVHDVIFPGNLPGAFSKKPTLIQN